MKIAYMILAHAEPKQLHRLVNALSNGENHFFIHINKNVEITPFEEELKGVDNIHFASVRYRVRWGGYSQTLGKLIMLEDACSCGLQFDRFVYLSGADYPIMSNKQMEKLYAHDPDKQYIAAYNLSSGTAGGDNQLWKLNIKWYFDSPFKSTLPHRIYKRIPKLVRQIENKVGIYKDVHWKSVDGEKKDIFFGCDFFSITGECGRFLLKEYKRQVYLQRYLKTAFCSLELFAQTIIFNSEFRDESLIFNTTNLEDLSPSHYFVLNDGDRVVPMTISNFDELINSGKLFFRKVDTKSSSELLDKLDAYRREKDREIVNA